MESTNLILIEADPSVFMERNPDTMGVEFFHTIGEREYWVEAVVELVPVEHGLRGWSRITSISIRDPNWLYYVFKFTPNEPTRLIFDGNHIDDIFEIVMICERIANPRWIKTFLTDDMKKAIMWSINDMRANFHDWITNEIF